MIRKGLIQSAHDCSDGGLAVTLAECSFSPKIAEGKPLGAKVQLKAEGKRLDALLFGETPSRVVLSVSPEHARQVLSVAEECGVPGADIGEVGGEDLVIRVVDESSLPGGHIQASISELFDRWKNSLERKLHD